MTAISSVFVSVIARVHNGAQSVEAFVSEMIQILRANYENFELVVIDDGSSDDTFERLSGMLKKLECIRIVRLSRPFGDDISFTAGLETAIGDYVVTMRLESDPPALVPQLVAMARETGAIVFGVNATPVNRKGIQKILAGAFYWAANHLFELPLVPNTTQFRCLSRQAVNSLVKVKDKYKSLRSITTIIGYMTRPFPYTPIIRGQEDKPPSFGEQMDRGVGMLVANSTKPLRLVSRLGLLASALNILYIVYIVLIGIFKRQVAEGWITLSAQHAVMFFLLFLILAVLTEYVGRILEESRDRPLYYVRDERQSSVVIAAEERRNIVRESK